MEGEISTEQWALVDLIADRVAAKQAHFTRRRPGCFDFADWRQEARIAMWLAFAGYNSKRGPLDAYLMLVAKRRMALINRNQLDTPLGIVDGPDVRVGAMPKLFAHEHTPEVVESFVNLEQVLHTLPREAARLLALCATGHSMRECAARLRMSRMRTYRLRQRALRALRYRGAA